MFTAKIISDIRTVIIFLRKTRLFPFEWDDTRNTLTTTTSLLTKLCICAYCLHFPPYILYLTWQIKGWSMGACTGFSVMDKYWLVMMLVGYIMCSECMYGPFLKRREQVYFFRQIVMLEGKLKRSCININQGFCTLFFMIVFVSRVM